MTARTSLLRRIEVSILLISVFFLAMLALVYYSKETLEDELFARQTAAELGYLRDLLAFEPDAALPRTANLAVFLLSRRERQPIPDYLAGLDLGVYHDITVDEHAYHVIVDRLGDDRVYLRFDVTEIERLEALTDAGLAVATALLLLVIFVVARELSRRLSAPVARLDRMLAEIDPDQRGVRLGEQFGEDEIGHIARAFDRYLEKMDDYVEKQMAFAAMASHELRSPLTVVQTSADLIASRHDEPAIREHLDKIRRAAGNMSSLVHALLSVTRDQPGVNLREVELAALVADVVATLEPDFRARGIRIDNRVTAETRLQADPILLGVVLSNLLRNSAKHGQDSDIVIEADAQALRIVDNGIGIDEAELERLFDFGYRGQRSQGYGVGLYIAKLICDAMGWRLTLAGNPGGGVIAAIDFAGAPGPAVND